MKKSLRVFISLILLVSLMYANTAGPNLAGAGATSGAGSAWVSTGNITACDTVKSTTGSIVASGTSADLQATTFAFSIPAGATINGIQADINKAKTAGAGTLNDNDVTLLKAGVATGTNLGTATTWTNANQTYGGASTLWGAAWGPSDINASNFGVQISAVEVGGVSAATAGVDCVSMTITFTPAAAASGSGFLKLFGFNQKPVVRTQTRTWTR